MAGIRNNQAGIDREPKYQNRKAVVGGSAREYANLWG